MIKLNEAKQIGVLYHFTNRDWIKILAMNYLKATYGYVSFTRNFNLDYSPIRFSFDGNKLSNRYKIESYADLEMGYGRQLQDESEERIKSIVKISPYLIQIDIKKDYAEDYLYGHELKDYELKYNITINIVDKWKPVKLY